MQDPLHWVSLRYKLALMFVGVCLLAFGVGGFLISASARGALEREIQARLEFQARAHATALDGELRSLARRLEDFASDGYIRAHVAGMRDDPNEHERLREELLRHLRVNKLPLVPAFAELRVVDEAGCVVADTSSADAATRNDDEVRAAPETFSGLVAPPRQEDPPLLVIRAPLRELASERRLGWLSVDVEAEKWIASALSSDLGEPQSAVVLELIDGAGAALRIDRELAAPTAESSPQARSGLTLTFTPAGAPRAATVASEEVFTRSFPIAANGWRAQVTLGADGAFAAVAGLQSRFVLVGVVLAIAAAALLYFPLQFLTRSLARLRDAARRIQSGDFSARVEVATEDELGELAGAFNLMAEAVEDRTHKTERAAQALRAESERLSAVIASMRDGLVVLGSDGRALLHNRSAAPLLDLIRRDGIASSHHRCRDDVVNGANCKQCLFDVEALPRSCVIEIEGGVYEVRSTRLASEGRGAGGRVLVSRDISDRIVQDEREIHQERLAVLGEVAAVMAHELNNPLAAISMFNQMLASEIEDASPLRENIDVIQRNVDTCKRAIRELLDYANNASPEMLDVDVEATLEDVVAFLRPMRQRANVELSVAFDAHGVTVRGDEVQLRQVFVNLVLNAIQACGGRPGRVELRTRCDGDAVVIDVVDNGSGIAPEHRAKIFKPFFTTKLRGEGTGLGLSTARRIAEMYGGSLELLTSDPSGTTFRVRLRRSAGAKA